MKIAVIGAGASGMTAALQAAWHGADVTLFEHNDTVGRKLTVTGSGHCNLTNDRVSPASYCCEDTNWMAKLLSQFGRDDLLTMLTEIGIPTRKTDDGWYYPLSNSAHSVVEVFGAALHLAGVDFHTGCHVTGIKKAENGDFIIRFTRGEKEQMANFNRVIVSAGGCAYPALGSRGDLFQVLEKLGHTTLPNRPALAPVLAETGKFKALQGMRFDVEASLWKGKDRLTAARGNLIFTEWGLNGPAVMDISHIITRHPVGSLELALDFLAFHRSDFDSHLAAYRQKDMTARVFLDAFFPPKASIVFLAAARITETAPLSQIDPPELDNLLHLLTNSRLPVKGVRGFDYCQISAGGVPVTETDPLTLESCRVKGLYLTGETLDVTGPCGGFNLQYAFSSGALAGIAAAG